MIGLQIDKIKLSYKGLTSGRSWITRFRRVLGKLYSILGHSMEIGELGRNVILKKDKDWKATILMVYFLIYE